MELALWARCVGILGMAERSFWTSSPAAVLEVLRLDDELRTARRTLEDWRFGILATEVANAGPWKPRGRKEWRPRDFFPELPAPGPQSVEQMIAVLEGVNARAEASR